MTRAQTDLERLRRAFETFRRASGDLERSYRELRERAARLQEELEVKNRELAANLADKERMETYLHDILESLTTGVAVLDPSGRITLCNRAASRLAGCDRGELRRRGPALLLGGGEDQGLDVLLARARGRTLVREVDGEERSLRLNAVRLRDRDGRCTGGLLLIEDITEILRLEHEAGRRNRLTAMGEMAANIAHEIRNPLGSIELYASILGRELGADRDKRDLAEQIRAGVRSLNHILSNLLYYTRPLRPAVRDLPAHDLWPETVRFAAHALREQRIRWRCERTGPDAVLQTDPELLKQVLINLVLNAVQAMPDGGRLLLASRVDRGTVRYTVRDTGRGIREEDLDKIFNPFFSTRAKGTGLGLAIAHQVVETLGGTIRVASRPGRGTTFTVELPLEPAAKGAAAATAAPGEAPR